MLLALAASVALAGAPEVKVTVTDGAAIGVKVEGTKDAAWLEKLVETSWLSRKGAVVLKLGQDVKVDAAAWAKRAGTAADGVAKRKDLTLRLEVTTIRLFVDEGATYAAVDGRWAVRAGWGDLAQGLLVGRARLTTGDLAGVEGAFDDAVAKMVSTQGFLAAWRDASDQPPASAQPIVLKRCARPADTLPEAVHATAVVRASTGSVGAGELVSPDGWLVTAAHVVRGATSVKVVFDDESEHAARVVRVAPEADVALLKVDGTHGACVAQRSAKPVLGEDLYVVGTPSGQALAFSVAKGIVSGVRDADGVHFVQSDVAVSPGNSGGPMVDARGGWLGVVAFKVVSLGAEGLSFAVRADDALSALKISFGEATVEPKDP